MASPPTAGTVAEAAVALASQLFPTTDPAFLRACVAHYASTTTTIGLGPTEYNGSDPDGARVLNRLSSSGAQGRQERRRVLQAADIVERISHKLLEETPGATGSAGASSSDDDGGRNRAGSDGGEWPRVRFWKSVPVEEGMEGNEEGEARGGGGRTSRLAQRQEVRRAFGGGGEGDGHSGGDSSAGQGRPAPDRTPRRRLRVVDVVTERNLALCVLPLPPES